jgi:hypothetical protein
METTLQIQNLPVVLGVAGVVETRLLFMTRPDFLECKTLAVAAVPLQ